MIKFRRVVHAETEESFSIAKESLIDGDDLNNYPDAKMYFIDLLELKGA